MPFPNVVGLTAAEASLRLQDGGFRVERTSTMVSPEEADKVLSTDPAPGAEVPPGSPVVLTVSAGPQPAPTTTAGPVPTTGPVTGGGGGGGGTTPVVVPAVVGHTAEDARQELERLGLRATVEERHVNDHPGRCSRAGRRRARRWRRAAR
ncbi:hypothetical protein BJF78_17620 [Pseudonocardia sp. CNS-139]|nr:hypothetical protein BJF78_17620 [Pseudonocardia sp. CNS-139]